jgi:hypothetical protein
MALMDKLTSMASTNAPVNAQYAEREESIIEPEAAEGEYEIGTAGLSGGLDGEDANVATVGFDSSKFASSKSELAEQLMKIARSDTGEMAVRSEAFDMLKKAISNAKNGHNSR